MSTLAETLRELRERRGWTQGQLALRANVSRSYVSRIERGEYKRPSGEILGKLADALEVPVQRLVSASKAPLPTKPPEEINLNDYELAMLLSEARKQLSPEAAESLKDYIRYILAKEERKKREKPPE